MSFWLYSKAGRLPRRISSAMFGRRTTRSRSFQCAACSRRTAAAVAFASKLVRELEADSARFVLQDRESGTEIEIEIDETIFDLFRQLLITFANNRAVSLIPYDHELITHQVARFLDVSRPFLVKLLDEGQIPHRKVGTHRRVRLEDLLSYREKTAASAEKAKEELAKISQELDMGY